ncbi:MAG: hypothetical protein ACYTGV_04180, partial [Planctomycetota bacterium]
MFSGVIGQERAIAALKAQLARTDGAGSTLIVGTDGIGRFLLAHRCARTILGTDPGAAARVDRFQHPDLLVLEPREGIDGVRSVRERLARVPAEGPRQVLIVRDADRMSVEAHNALLKTLEEPPAGAAIYLIAEGPEFLPETVVSRCRVVRATPLSEAECKEVLSAAGASAEAAGDAEGAPGRAIYHLEAGVPAAATELVDLLLRPGADPLSGAEKVARRRSGEELKDHRKRMIEILRVSAARLRRRLPESENGLRSVTQALRSLGRNANPAIVFADLALTPWTRITKAARKR